MKRMPDKKLFRDFFLGFVRVHILHHAAEEPIYGAGISRELARHGYHLSPGSLYPILHALEADGYLNREDRVVEGRVRKYYSATTAGRGVLTRARKQIEELVDEVVREERRPG